MITSILKFLVTLLLVLGSEKAAQAKLTVKTENPKHGSGKSIVKVTLKNTFEEKVESARATLFLMDDQDKVVGQKSEWVIGGTKDKPGLSPNATTTYNFVVPSDKPFTKTKLIFNRIILDGGKQVDPVKGFEVEK